MNYDYQANVPKSPIYLDIVATHGSDTMNAHSVHCLGSKAQMLLKESNDIAHKLFPQFKTIEFVPGGGSMANLRGITGLASLRHHAKMGSNDIIMISSIEHSSISKYAMIDLIERGYTVIVYPVLLTGVIDLVKFGKLMELHKERIILISCMYANNETGIIQPIFEMIEMVKTISPKIIFHCDAGSHLQIFCDQIVQPDIVTGSGYKYGGSHIGILLSNATLKSTYYGTPDTLQICATVMVMKKYFEEYKKIDEQNAIMKKTIISKLFPILTSEKIPYVLLGADLPTQNNVVSFIIPWLRASIIQTYLSKHDIAIGSGSACTTNEGSHTLQAMGYSSDISQKLIRLSFDSNTHTDTTIDDFIVKFIESIEVNKYLASTKPIQQIQKIERVIRPSARESVIIDIPLDTELTAPKYTKIMLTYAELHLKGQNKKSFVDILKHNITLKLKEFHLKYYLIEQKGYLYICFEKCISDYDITPIVEKLIYTSGISYVIPIMSTHITDVLSVCTFVAAVFSTKYTHVGNTFKIITTSNAFLGKKEREWDYYLGQYIKDRFHVNVDLDSPDIILRINATDGHLNVGIDKYPSLGGLPCGSEGIYGIVVTNRNIIRSCFTVFQMSRRGVIPSIFYLDVDPKLITNMNKIAEQLVSNYTHVILTTTDDWYNIIFTKTHYEHVIVECDVTDDISFSNILHILKNFGKHKQMNVFSNTLHLHQDIVNSLMIEELQNFKSLTMSENYGILQKNKIDGINIIDLLKTHCVGTDKSFSYKGLMLISGGIDSPVASHQLITNGHEHDYVHFISSFDDEVSIAKITKIIKKINPYSTIWFVEFGKLQSEIAKTFDEKYRVMLYKIYMVIIANKLCHDNNYDYISMGNSWGQVASQTPKNIYITDAFSDVPIVSPLLSFNKNYIIKCAQDCKTYEESICDGNDCCVMFLPKHPTLAAKSGYIKYVIDTLGDWTKYTQIKMNVIF